MSFRAFVLVGIVTLVTAFYQSTQPSAFTVTKGLTSRQRVELGPFPLNSTLCGTKSGSRAYSRIVVQAPRRPFTRSVEFPKVALLAHGTRRRP